MPGSGASQDVSPDNTNQEENAEPTTTLTASAASIIDPKLARRRAQESRGAAFRAYERAQRFSPCKHRTHNLKACVNRLYYTCSATVFIEMDKLWNRSQLSKSRAT